MLKYPISSTISIFQKRICRAKIYMDIEEIHSHVSIRTLQGKLTLKLYYLLC